MPTNNNTDNFLYGNPLDGGYLLLITSNSNFTFSVLTIEEAGQEMGGN